MLFADDCLRWKISYPSTRRWLDRGKPREMQEIWYACQTIICTIINVARGGGVRTVHTPMALTGATRETQEKRTPAGRAFII